MSGASPRQPREQRMDAALNEAMSGGLPLVDSFKLVARTRGGYQTTVPQFLVNNTSVEPGDEGAVYVDIDNECLVISYGDE